MSKIIKCQVNDEYVLGSGVVIGAAGSYGDVILHLRFNEMWDGLAIMATFRDALNQNPKVVMLVSTMLVDGEVRTYEVYIPAEAKQIAGRVRLTLTGYSTYTVNDDGSITTFKDSLTNTSTAFFRVLESDAALLDDGSIGDHPTPTLAEQALAAINEASRILGEADGRLNETDMKLGEFDDAETARADAELSRQEAENARKEAETARGQALEKHIQDPAYEGLHGRLKPGKGAYSVRSATSQKDDASGQGALSLGYGTEASGYHAAAIGVNTIASGYHAFATGKDTEASGESSSAHGEYTSAKEKRQFVVGSFNADEATATFIVGVGQNTADRNNAFSAGKQEDGLRYITVGAQVLTEEQVSLLLKLLDRYEIDIGDIDTALDGILAIQESLMGGDE